MSRGFLSYLRSDFEQQGPKLSPVSHSRAVLTKSNEENCPIPHKNCVKRKKNISCILSFVAERILGNGISYLDLLAA